MTAALLALIIIILHALTHVIYPGYLLLLLFFYSKETGAVDGDHNFL